MCRLLTLLFGAGLMVLLATGTGYAHSGLDTGTPGPGDGVRAGLDRVELRFTGNLALRKSHQVELADAHNQNQVAGDSTISGSSLSAPLHALEPGLHKVRYSVIFIDGHHVSGSYYFSVLPNPQRASGAGTTPLLLSGGIALVVILMLTGILLRNRSHRAA